MIVCLLVNLKMTGHHLFPTKVIKLSVFGSCLILIVFIFKRIVCQLLEKLVQLSITSMGH